MVRVVIPPCLLNASQCTADEQAFPSLAPPGLFLVPRHVGDELLVVVATGFALSVVSAASVVAAAAAAAVSSPAPLLLAAVVFAVLLWWRERYNLHRGLHNTSISSVNLYTKRYADV